MVFDFRGLTNFQFPTRYAHGHVRRYSTCYQHDKLFTRRQIHLQSHCMQDLKEVMESLTTGNHRYGLDANFNKTKYV
jgi:hypothetical protein